MGTLSFLFPCLLFLWGVRGDVGENFLRCNDAFFKGTPVSGLNIALPAPKDSTEGLVNYEECLSAYDAPSPAYICQRYINAYYFATLYDRGRRIPLYSAYQVDLRGETGREGAIKNHEPQLVHPGLAATQEQLKPAMAEIQQYNKGHKCESRHVQYRPRYKLGWSQALDDDFRVGDYDRGHLNPPGHHVKGEPSLATMTFTNVAPQNKQMNNGVWSQYEIKVKNVLSAGCSKMYVVTGVVPSAGEWLNQRVNVPSHYWSAFCCTDNNDKPVKSGGAICPNLNVQEDTKVTEYDSIAQLETKLRELLEVGQNFYIFNNGCV